MAKFWYEQSDGNLTDEQQASKCRDYALMFYGSMTNKAIFAEICKEVDDMTSSDVRNILKDFIQNIKSRCGLNDHLKIIESESKSLIS